MATTIHNDEDRVAADREALAARIQQVSWGALFVGLVLAVAVQILLTLLGIGIGFAAIDPSEGLGGVGGWGFGTFLYIIIAQIVALYIGGYAAARLSRARTGTSAMFHGATVWALALLATIWLGTTTAGLAVSGVSAAVSGIGSVATKTVEAVIPDDIGNINLPDIGMEDLPEPMQRTLERNNLTPADLQRETRQAFQEVFTEREQRRVVNQLQQAAQDILRDPADAAEEIEQTVDEIYATILSDRDLQQMEDTLQRRLNLSDQDVRQLTNTVEESIAELRREAAQTLEEAQEQAVEAAEAVVDQISSIAFWMFVASVLGLVAAVFGSKAGEKGRVVH